MTKAFVLITCVLGTESDVLQNLKSIDSIKEAHQTFGSYDIIASVDNTGKENIQDVIRQIRKIDDVKSTSTLIVTKI